MVGCELWVAGCGVLTTSNPQPATCNQLKLTIPAQPIEVSAHAPDPPDRAVVCLAPDRARRPSLRLARLARPHPNRHRAVGRGGADDAPPAAAGGLEGPNRIRNRLP